MNAGAAGLPLGPAFTSPARKLRRVEREAPEAPRQLVLEFRKKRRRHPPFAYPFDVFSGALNAQDAQRPSMVIVALFVIFEMLMSNIHERQPAHAGWLH